MVKIRINEKVRKLKEKSKSKNTQIKYEGDWLKFIDYCKIKHNCNPLDVDDLESAYALTANYMDWLYEDPEARKTKGTSKRPERKDYINNPYSSSAYKGSTIQRILSSITYKYRSNGFLFDRRNSDIADTISAILRNEKNKTTGQAKELLKKDIVKIIDVLSNSDDLRDLRDKALILIGFYSFCRRSELLSMKYEHLNFSENSIEVWIPFSKTDQKGEGRVITLPKTSDIYCPVKSLNTWLSVSNIKEGPLFYKINKSNKIEKDTLRNKDFTKISLTDSHFVLILKKRAFNAGIADSENISGHSLRIGAITQARMNGVAVHEIMAQSGHKTTQMIDRYTKISNIKEISAAKKI